jgi:hypothetical protein
VIREQHQEERNSFRKFTRFNSEKLDFLDPHNQIAKSLAKPSSFFTETNFEDAYKFPEMNRQMTRIPAR